MDRRELLGLTPGFLLCSLLSPGARPWSPAGQSRRSLFYDQGDIPRIRENARSPLLRDMFEKWLRRPETETLEILRRPMETGDLVSDLGRTLREIEEQSLVYLVTGERAKAELLLAGIDVALALPKWDWFLDGESEIGIMRASQAVGALLFAMEALGDLLGEGHRSALHTALAEKGVEPCNRAVRGMDDHGTVTGWRPDERHRERYPYDMSRWPQFFSENNLRAVSTMGLGLGGLALNDGRAAEWLERAVASAKTYLGRHEPDGSYWEGISYVNYAFSTLFVFLEAYDRARGDVDWLEYANFEGINAYIAAMQAGRQQESGEPDVVNFSDARTSTSVSVNAWLADHTRDPLAQFNTEHFSRQGHFADFLWYRPGLPSAPPPPVLKNVRLDLDWIITRTGWGEDDAVLAFRGGRPANHEHADRNSFLYKIHGERLLTDHFGASYDPRLPSWLLRQTAAHNSVLVDGRGHQYVDGSEGTNAGKARADILRYEVEGDTVWWVSDATPGYRLVNDTISLVRRSILYLKPDWIVVFDEFRTDGPPARFAARFFPDNRDLRARLSTGESVFSIDRPRAMLSGWAASSAAFTVRENALDLPDNEGVFPFVEVLTGPDTHVELVTLLHASRVGADPRVAARISRRGTAWTATLPGQTVTIGWREELPEFSVHRKDGGNDDGRR